jgi:four helix bundle protein
MAGAPARSFRDLRVWQKAHGLVLAVYQTTAAFPKAEQFGLCAQMRGAAVSIAANIAEAFGRATRPDKARMLNIAQGSLDELRYYFLLARDLGYPLDEALVEAAEEVGRMLDAYRRKVISTN